MAGNGAPAGKRARLPLAGADARGEHDRQQGPGRRTRSARWSGSRPRSSASASRCRTLSERAARRDRGLGALGGRQDHRRRPRAARGAGPALLGLAHHAPAARRRARGRRLPLRRSPELRAPEGRRQAARVGRGARQSLRHRARRDRARASARAWTCCWTSTCRARRRSASACRTRSRSSSCRRPTRSSSSGCAAAARTTRRRSQRRLAAATREIGAFEDYEYALVNDDLDACVEGLKCIIRAARSRVSAVAERARAICRTFDDKRGDEDGMSQLILPKDVD